MNLEVLSHSQHGRYKYHSKISCHTEEQKLFLIPDLSSAPKSTPRYEFNIFISELRGVPLQIHGPQHCLPYHAGFLMVTP